MYSKYINAINSLHYKFDKVNNNYTVALKVKQETQATKVERDLTESSREVNMTNIQIDKYDSMLQHELSTQMRK